MPETNARIKVCHDTAANFKTNNPTLLVGEWALETDTKKMKIGDGSTIYNSLPYSTVEENNEWVKPTDWIDIRSGALPNSIYLLVAHSAPVEEEGVLTVSSYPYFAVTAIVSDSGTYDVFVDGNKIATTNSNTTTTLDWASLYLSGTVTSIFSVTYPANLTTHVIRITPSDSSNTITKIITPRPDGLSGTYNNGTLWAHFTLSNSIEVRLSGRNYSEPVYSRSAVMDAITSENDILHVKNLQGLCENATSIKKIPELDLGNITVSATEAFGYNLKLSNIKISNCTISDARQFFAQIASLKEITLKNCKLGSAQASPVYNKLTALKTLPALDFRSATTLGIFSCPSLEPFVADLSEATSLSRLFINGENATNHILGLKGVTVSNTAPFDNATSPQINVSYTGLDRAALVKLFKSMPYNNSITLTGAAEITNGVLSNVKSGTTPISTANTLLEIPSNYNKIEMILKVGHSDTVDAATSIPIIGFGAYNASQKITLTNVTNKGLHFDVDGSDTYSSTVSNNSFDFISAINTNGHFFAKFIVEKVIDGYDCTISASADGTTWTDGNTYNVQSDLFGGKFLSLCRNATGAATGKALLYLNDSTIKIDGVEWGQFATPTAMTKTCSVVGCTGTTDLTADDKAIATSKGWELTVE